MLFYVFSKLKKSSANTGTFQAPGHSPGTSVSLKMLLLNTFRDAVTPSDDNSVICQCFNFTDCAKHYQL